MHYLGYVNLITPLLQEIAEDAKGFTVTKYSNTAISNYEPSCIVMLKYHLGPTRVITLTFDFNVKSLGSDRTQ